jgi:mono/diheme cytochrome c family protein
VNRVLLVIALALLTFSVVAGFAAPPAPPEDLDTAFAKVVRPILERNCFRCHGPKKQEAELDLSKADSTAAVVKNLRHWETVLERLQAKEMPPEDARQPTAEERAAVIDWVKTVRDREVARNAGDPGRVLAHRLSNAEYDYTIRDLTGIDLKPTREFPVDPANQAGFDNSGESLSLSPALLKKYLAAARWVAEHLVLKPEGIAFAPHPVVTDTDRDKYAVHRILDFYASHNVDLADYFEAAWKYRHRAALGQGEKELAAFASEARLSPKYLAVVWDGLTAQEAGPLAVVAKLWNELPPPEKKDTLRAGCERLRDVVVKLRKQLRPKPAKLQVNGISAGSQPFVLWSNRYLARQHLKYSGEVIPDVKKLVEQLKGADEPLARLIAVPEPNSEGEKALRKGLERFCGVFPDAFVVIDRGPYFSPNSANQGRPLTAGFHLMQGYFRDDGPLYELILDDKGRRELDDLWFELNFLTSAPMRQYKDFIFFERAEPPRFMFDAEFDFARSEDKDAISEAKMTRLAKAHVGRAKKLGASQEAIEAIDAYYTSMSAEIRKVERTRLAAEPGHLQALLDFAERAYRRTLVQAERDDLRALYRTLRDKGELNHEDALRDALTTVLLSPHFCFRFQIGEAGASATPLSPYELASRLSYFLWSSQPDAELLAHAARGDLHKPDVLRAQTRRLLRDPRVRGLATEFAGNWLDIRRFEEHNSVDRARFPSFTNGLRQAMFEEPVRYFIDLSQRNRSVLDLLYGNDTFVNRQLARHYGMPEPKSADEWAHIEDAGKFGRGGLLPMAVFLTKNAPGLRTSPVKRGYWVVRRLLGEVIPPPPPAVPELPKDEATLGELTLPQVLARHRDNKSCAGCHRRFDSVGLVFERFGPIGERRLKDLGGRPVQTTATFPDGSERQGLAGLQAYLREKRQEDFVDNLCRKLFSYALGRSLILSDKLALEAMRTQLVRDKYEFGSLIEAIVTSPQFLNKRGRDDTRE